MVVVLSLFEKAAVSDMPPAQRCFWALRRVEHSFLEARHNREADFKWLHLAFGCQFRNINMPKTTVSITAPLVSTTFALQDP